MKTKMFTLLFFSLTVFTGCLSQDDLSDDGEKDAKTAKIDNALYDELDGISSFLRLIVKDDDMYKEKSETPRILKTDKKKFKTLISLVEEEKYKDQWNDTYFIYDQKPRYFKINDIEYLSFDGGQCVDGIYSLTNHKVSVNNWIKGEQVVSAKIDPGTVIATFNEKGQYYGHAAVFRSKTDKYIEVFDQNWWASDKTGTIIGWTKNIFCTHRITGSTGVYNPNNINNYYVVMVK
jgi:hypothetical protein